MMSRENQEIENAIGIGRKNHLNLSELEMTDLVDVVEKIKLELERTRMENLWMEDFLRRQDALLMPMTKKRFSMRESQRRMSASGTRKPSLIQPLSSHLISPVLKAELCHMSTFEIENELKKKQKQVLAKMKTLVAEIQESQLSSKELSKAVSKFKEFVIERGVDKKSNKISSQVFLGFLNDLSKNGTILLESIRLKTSTMKKDFRNGKRLVAKRGELSSCLRPVDYELALIEKKQFQKLEEEKQRHFMGLREEERGATLCKISTEKLLQETTAEHDRITEKSNLCQISINQMESKLEKSQIEIGKLMQSIEKLKEMSSKFDAPTVVDYIGKIDERDRMEIHLKASERKAVIAKFALKKMKVKHRQQLEIMKNYQ